MLVDGLDAVVHLKMLEYVLRVKMLSASLALGVGAQELHDSN